MNTIARKSTVSFMKLVYQGGQRSHPNNVRTIVDEDQCSELVNLVQEISNTIPGEDKFIELIYEAFNVTAEMMENTKLRKRVLVMARQLHIYIRRRFYKKSLAESAEIYDKDHATALHCVKTINNLIETDKFYRHDTEKIWKLWYNSGVVIPDDIYRFIIKIL